jgi:hypothetical protein
MIYEIMQQLKDQRVKLVSRELISADGVKLR